MVTGVSDGHQLEVKSEGENTAIKEIPKIKFENVRLVRCLETSELSLKVIEIQFNLFIHYIC